MVTFTLEYHFRLLLQNVLVYGLPYGESNITCVAVELRKMLLFDGTQDTRSVPLQRQIHDGTMKLSPQFCVDCVLVLLCGLRRLKPIIFSPWLPSVAKFTDTCAVTCLGVRNSEVYPSFECG